MFKRHLGNRWISTPNLFRWIVHRLCFDIRQQVKQKIKNYTIELEGLHPFIGWISTPTLFRWIVHMLCFDTRQTSFFLNIGKLPVWTFFKWNLHIEGFVKVFIPRPEGVAGDIVVAMSVRPVVRTSLNNLVKVFG